MEAAMLTTLRPLSGEYEKRYEAIAEQRLPSIPATLEAGLSKTMGAVLERATLSMEFVHCHRHYFARRDYKYPGGSGGKSISKTFTGIEPAVLMTVSLILMLHLQMIGHLALSGRYRQLTRVV
jgi:hypothetical protein